VHSQQASGGRGSDRNLSDKSGGLLKACCAVLPHPCSLTRSPAPLLPRLRTVSRKLRTVRERERFELSSPGFWVSGFGFLVFSCTGGCRGCCPHPLDTMRAGAPSHPRCISQANNASDNRGAVAGWFRRSKSSEARSTPPASRRAPTIFHCLGESGVAVITPLDRPWACYPKHKKIISVFASPFESTTACI
jgi:hypothetical protein